MENSRVLMFPLIFDQDVRLPNKWKTPCTAAFFAAECG
jgi:hypothetical protein